MTYRIETGCSGEYDCASAAEAARCLRWIRSRFDADHLDPMGYLIIKRDGEAIFTAHGSTLVQAMPEDLSVIIRNEVLKIGEEFRKYSRLGTYVLQAAALNETPPASDTELRQMGLLAWADATHRGYMTASKPVRFEPYIGRYGVGLVEHYRYGAGVNYHGVRYWVESQTDSANPFLPAEED